MKALVFDKLEMVISDAISCDGRGHFLATYDHDEIEHTYDGITYYIYRR